MADTKKIQKEEEVNEAPKAEESKKKCKKEQSSCKEELKKQEEEFKKKIEAVEGALAKEKDDYIRLMAEFETFRRRSSEDRLSLISSAAADTIKGLLPVLDDCERALEILEKSSDEAAKEGTSLIYTKLMDYLKTKGLTRIEAKGEDFNTDFHEAVTQFPAPSEELKGKVIDVVQTGYLLNGKVLRYAKVVVGA
ncbi:MAG TPA: nucleotide exchange factor GrpE [Rikenellaceae bacterium]|nr:nucleotide exchange factor GrpE [Rikenellaceae bacterium]HBH21405.1 nucleotide exchange factor GrpE [Rikenellaceae bacterium]